MNLKEGGDEEEAALFVGDAVIGSDDNTKKILLFGAPQLSKTTLGLEGEGRLKILDLKSIKYS